MLEKRYPTDSGRLFSTLVKKYSPNDFEPEKALCRTMRRLAQTIFSTRYRRMQKIFDAAYYLDRNEDVRSYGASPFEHFLNHGFKEGRDPSARFCTLYYKDKYLKTTGFQENPLLAYVSSGIAQNKLLTVPTSAEEYLALQADIIRPYFDFEFYRALSGLTAPAEALQHYLQSGWRQGLEPHRGFDSQDYLAIHTHVDHLRISPFYHYISTAEIPVFDIRRPPIVAEQIVDEKKIERSLDDIIYETIKSEFDRDYYLIENVDVAEYGIDPLEHYISYGWKEDRRPNELFWSGYYLEKYEDVQREGVNPFYHFLRIGRAEGRKTNPIGRAKWPKTQAPLWADWQGLPSRADLEEARVIVIMPVYKGYDETLRAIHSVLAEPQSAALALMVLNDRSPDAKLADALKALSERGLFRYLENEINLGFVGTINKALSVSGSKDVVLLNSDTIVFGDWLDRLLAHADRDPRIGTITPMSNNATICSYPDANRNNLIALEVSPRELDAYAAACNAGHGVEVPTGVGFCFYMRGALIDRVGALDVESFGKGYGEENDYCMRILKAGYKNVFATDVFVYHSGRISFSDFYDDEYHQGQSALHRKHPDYLVRVERYLAADPAADARLMLDLFRLAKGIGRSSAVFVVHSQGGGASVHADHLARRLVGEGTQVVYFVVSDDETIEIMTFEKGAIYTPSLRFLSLIDDYRIIDRFIDWLQPRFIHVHSFYGLSWTSTTNFMDLVEQRPEPLVVTLHDYSGVCLKNHLVNGEGNYCGLPHDRPCSYCSCNKNAHPSRGSEPRRWERFGSFYRSADQLIAPSRDVAARITGIFGDLPIALKPHEEDLDVLPLERIDQARTVLRVAIIGAIGSHKGSGTIYSLAFDAQARKLPIEYYVVGYSEMPQKMASVGVVETGRYMKPEQAVEKMKDLDIDLVFLPSIWPETYCYTLSIALAAKVPVAVFDLGAQADRLRDLEAGFILAPDLIYDPALLNDRILALPVEDMWSTMPDVAFARYGSLLRDYYGFEHADETAAPALIDPAVSGEDRRDEGRSPS